MLINTILKTKVEQVSMLVTTIAGLSFQVNAQLLQEHSYILQFHLKETRLFGEYARQHAICVTTQKLRLAMIGYFSILAFQMAMQTRNA